MSMFLTTNAGLGKGKILQSNSSEHANSHATGNTISICFYSIIK
jgi:hypothetical protein